MSEALPALVFGLTSSVIALFGRPPPLTSSSAATPLDNSVAAAAVRCGNRSASNLRRSTREFAAAMPRAWHKSLTCSSEQFNSGATPPVALHLRKRDACATLPFPPFLFADQRHHHALDFQFGRRD